MPELPEVETMRRGILAIQGATVTHVEKVRCTRKPISIKPTISTIRRRIVGQQVQAVQRIGKRVLIRFKNDDHLVFEPRMTGLVLVSDPPSSAHLRFRIGFSGGIDEVFFWDRRGLGLIYLLTAAELLERLGPDKLGPDALVVNGEDLHRIFGASKRPIKVALLDQKRIAGVGNLYASELLHLAGIHPAKMCHRITAKQWSIICEAMQTILHAAIEQEGSTLSDGTYRNALNDPGGYQNMHRVYDKENTTCSTCHSQTIERIVQAQRSTFFCKDCQTRA